MTKEYATPLILTTPRNALKTHCKRGHPFDESNTYYSKNGWRHCRTCRREIVYAERLNPETRAKYLAQKRKARMAMEFSLTVEQYDAMLKSQGGGCAICRETCKTGRRLSIDHDHETGVIRGLLCMRCNLGIGNLRSPENAMRAALYLIAGADG